MTFKVLKGRQAEKEELDFYLQSYNIELRKSVLAVGNVPDTEIDEPIDLDTQYVKLVLQDISDEQVAFGEDILPAVYLRNLENQEGKEGLNVDEILPRPSRGTSTLLKGRAGVGKSTLTQNLNRLWAKHEWESSKTCVFLLNLRKLIHVKRDTTFTEMLGLYAEYVIETPDQHQPSLQWIQNNAHNVMIFTDGIDELSDLGPLLRRTPKLNLTEDTKATPLDWCLNLMQKKILQDCTKVLISRPFEDLKKLPCDRVIDVLGLTQEKIMEFIEKNVNTSRRRIVQDTLAGNPVLLSVCAITFYCAALCKVLEVNLDINGMLLNTYTRITAYLIMCLAGRNANENALSLFMSDAFEKCLPFLAQLAHRGLMHPKNGLTQLIFSEEDLRATGISQEGMRAARQSGLLTYSKHRDPQNPSHQRLQVQFIHLSVQEFLAAAKMVALEGEGAKTSFKFSKSGHFRMRNIFAFGLVFDKTNVNMNIERAVNERQNTSSVDEEAETWALEIYKEMTERAHSDKDAFFHALLVAYESQRKDLARELAEQVIFDGNLKVHHRHMNAVDVMALCFMLSAASLEGLDFSVSSLDTAAATEIRDFLKKSRTLKSFEFHTAKKSDEAMKMICEGVGLSPILSHLKMHLSLNSDKTIDYLSDALSSSSSLTSLHAVLSAHQE